MSIVTTPLKQHLPRQPLRAGLSALLRLAPHLRPRVQELVWRAVYETASLGRRDLVATMNYGYAGDAVATVGPTGAEDRFGLGLYAATLAGTELAGKDVLEVGCGRGGGALFILRRFKARSVVGVDLAASAIHRARRDHGRPGLRFAVGSAERLPFADGTFDAVVSVESTHCYPDIPCFLREARRVLRPGGLLALADFRRVDALRACTDGSRQDLQSLRDQLSDCGFGMIEEQDITANVSRALELNSPAVRARIERRVPRSLRRHALEFAAVEGSGIYADFAHRRLTYVRLLLRRH